MKLDSNEYKENNIRFSPALHNAGCVPLRATGRHWKGTGPHKMSAEMQFKIYGILNMTNVIKNNFNNIKLYNTLKLLRNSLPSSWSSRMAKTMWRIAVPSTCLNWSCGIDWTSKSRLLRKKQWKTTFSKWKVAMRFEWIQFMPHAVCEPLTLRVSALPPGECLAP